MLMPLLSPGPAWLGIFWPLRETEGSASRQSFVWPSHLRRLNRKEQMRHPAGAGCRVCPSR